MSTEKRNLAASVAARLLNRAKETLDDYQRLFTSYCFERFLFRLGASKVHERFVLKGAMCLQLWADRPYRATRDLDLLRLGDTSFEAIREDLVAICAADVPADGIELNSKSIRLETIRAQDEEVGARAFVEAGCGPAKYPLQIDLGVGDAVWPVPTVHGYPTLLQFPEPRILAYPPEAMLAEKLEALIVRGLSNSRIKDFFDIQYLSNRFEFDRQTLVEAVRRSFAKRKTEIPQSEPIGLSEQYWRDPMRKPQIVAFARRARLQVTSDPGEEILTTLRPFLNPVLQDLRSGQDQAGTWPRGGPWGPKADTTGHL